MHAYSSQILIGHQLSYYLQSSTDSLLYLRLSHKSLRFLAPHEQAQSCSSFHQGEGEPAELSTKRRGPVGPVGAHYSYGEGELAELSTKAAIDSPIHMGEVTCEDRPGRPGRVRVRVRVRDELSTIGRHRRARIGC